MRTRGSQHSALLKDGPAPPDKTAYEEKIKKLTSHIEEKEKQIVSCLCVCTCVDT